MNNDFDELNKKQNKGTAFKGVWFWWSDICYNKLVPELFSPIPDVHKCKA